MSSERTIDFITLGGTRTGMGHLVRCATLAMVARARGWRVRAFVEGRPDARERWQEISGGAAVASPWRHWQPAASPCVVALDFPHRKTRWLDRLARHQQSALVIDDPGHRAEARWTLLPALHHASAAHASDPAGRAGAAHASDLADRAGVAHASDLADRASVAHVAAPTEGAVSPHRLLAGPRYAILSPEHLAGREPARAARTRLLLSMGGADPHHLTPKLAPLLQQALAATAANTGVTSLDVVLGPAFDDPGGVAANHLQQAGWQVHSAIEAGQMAVLMRESRLAVIGFGTSLGELAYHRTPFLTVTHHPHDRAPARDLEAQGIGRVLGTAGALDPASILRRTRNALEDTEWQRTSAQQAFDMIEGGRGAQRVFEAIEADLFAARPIRPPVQRPLASPAPR